MRTRYTGRVKFFDHARQFGFAERDGEGSDLFLSGKMIDQALANGLERGTRISFRIKSRGTQPNDLAVDVKILTENALGATEPKSDDPYAER